MAQAFLSVLFLLLFTASAQTNTIQAYNDVARTAIQQARDTGEPKHLSAAEQAIKKSLELQPENLETGKLQAALLLARHEYAKARDAAKALHKRNADDVQIWSEIADAAIALGDYKEAEEATQWMLDLRTLYSGGLERAATLRRLFGDPEGALEMWNSALRLTSDREAGEKAWILSQAAGVQLEAGKLESADQLLTRALSFFPNHYPALRTLAKLRLAQRRYPDAVEILRKLPPCGGNLFLLAQALEKTYADFESTARNEMNSPDNANRELVLYYSRPGNKPAEALAIARREIAIRHDVFTLDAFAWALHANGDDAEAQKQMEKALAVGIRNAGMFAHAAGIAASLKDNAAAEKYRKQAADLGAIE